MRHATFLSCWKMAKTNKNYQRLIFQSAIKLVHKTVPKEKSPWSQHFSSLLNRTVVGTDKDTAQHLRITLWVNQCFQILFWRTLKGNIKYTPLDRNSTTQTQLATKLFISNITNVWSIKSIPIFRPKWLINHTPWGQQYLCSLYEGVTPLRGLVWTLENLSHFFHWAKFC